MDLDTQIYSAPRRKPAPAGWPTTLVRSYSVRVIWMEPPSLKARGFTSISTGSTCAALRSDTVLRAFGGMTLPGRIGGRSWRGCPLELCLDAVTGPVNHLTIRFETPTELKADGHAVERPEFGVLAARVRDRISTLRALYDDGPLTIDFHEFGERAARIHMTRCNIRHVETARRSSRTGQTHSLGGFIGEAEYAGDLTEFVPYLRAAQWTGVGRQTAWGKGALVVTNWGEVTPVRVGPKTLNLVQLTLSTERLEN